jgi:hypothetical protein
MLSSNGLSLRRRRRNLFSRYHTSALTVERVVRSRRNISRSLKRYACSIKVFWSQIAAKFVRLIKKRCLSVVI